MVIGAPDTGKSTLARYLYQALCKRGISTAYLDTDVGQSTLGTPTTMTVALGAGPGDDSFPPQGDQATYFVGANTPRGHMLPTVIGAFRLQQWALAQGTEALVVDTTGLVDKAHGGQALKQWKMELLVPGVVISLQRGRELEPILWPLRRDDRVQSLELPASPHAVERSRRDRITSRRLKLTRYFEEAQPRTLSLRQVAIYDVQRLAPGDLLAFQDGEGFALGLGVVEQVDHVGGIATVQTPLPESEDVTSVRCGTVRWDLINKREF
jgi:polynucleotide 5'-hydroxyl-kinase GRC3/NOL9